MELHGYIKWMHGFLASMDKELGVMNDGPVTSGGPVADALDKFDKFIQDPSKKGEHGRLMRLNEKFFEKPVGFYSSFLQLTR
jgi:hypothetical protein